MKETRVRHINKIPNNWNLIKIKYLFNIGRGRVISELELNPEGLYPVYSSQTKDDGCMGYINTFDYSIPQLTWTTDGVYAGTVFYREGKYNCTNICGTLAPKSSDFDLRFLKYALEFIAIYHKRPDTNGAKIMNNEMANIEVPLPHLVEQKSIVKFLNTKCSNIDNIIDDLEQQIEILEKYKKSVITEAVTKGLNRDVKMKVLNVKWINSVPIHWTIKRVKHLATEKDSLFIDGDWIESDIIVDEGVRYLTTGNVGVGVLKKQGQGYISKETFRKLNCLKVIPGDLMISRLNEPIGRACIVDDEEPYYVVAVDNVVLRPNRDCDKRFLMYVMNSNGYTFEANLIARGATMPRISRTQLGNMWVPFPVDIEEQYEISSFLDKKCAEIDSIIEDKKTQIETIKKYKNSLIYEYVTGKKRVGQGDANE